MSRSAYLLVRDDLDRQSYALMSDSAPTRRLGGIAVPLGADEAAVKDLLLSMSGLGPGTKITVTLRATAEGLGRAASRYADALGLPVRIVDIAPDAGRVAAAHPDRDFEYFSSPESALVPNEPQERRRRCDAVMRDLGDPDRAAVADRLGDIADRPISGRDLAGDRARSAAAIDAIRSLADRAPTLVGDSTSDRSGELLIVTGLLARQLVSRAVPLSALVPLVSPGRTTVLLDRSGVIAALGSEQLADETGLDLARATASELLEAGGDLLVVRASDRVLVMQRGSVADELPTGRARAFDLRPGESVDLAVEWEGSQLRTTLSGGLGGAAVANGPVGSAEIMSSVAPAPVAITPIEAPLELLPRSASASGGLGGRILLGDEVEGILHFSATEPDSRGWSAAFEAGVLAVVSASPETVLRARAVGLRGLVVGSLSDGEREALSASMDRRTAAGVAAAPFGLLILGGRTESEAWTAHLGEALKELDAQKVRLQRAPAGLIASRRASPVAPRGSDVAVIGGPLAGAYGTWRGLADADLSDPRGAVEVDGRLVAVALGDLQRLTA